MVDDDDDDLDITSNYHGGNPQSRAAHANTFGQRVGGRRQLETYLENRPRGATSYEAGRDLGFVRPSFTARFSELRRHKTAFWVSDLHRYDLFPDIEETRSRPGSRAEAHVAIGRQQLLATYGPNALELMMAADDHEGGLRGDKAAIEAMNEGLWDIYNFVHRCERRGATSDQTERDLRLDQSNCSTRFSALRKVKAVVAVADLHRYGEFLDVYPQRPTRQFQDAAVLVSAGTVFSSEISDDKLGQIFTVAEIERLQQLLFE